ncbi:MAG: formate/nitrite transporter family protein [Terrimicrobiaceae bacterium]
MQTTEDVAGEKEKEFKSENLVWTRIYYGREVMDRILDTIDVKRALHKRFFLRYTLRAAMAGVIICLMYIFAYQVKTDVGQDFNAGLNKYLMSASFSMALVFIYFTNSELLTSNFMYFTVGRYYDKVSWGDTIRIWSLCLVGNLLGIVVIAVLVWSCGMLKESMVDNLVHTVNDKTSNSAWLIFVKAIFANYFINVSVIVAMQLKEHLAKILVLLMGVTVFAYMGFDHVIANSALFVMALLEQPENVSAVLMGKNFLLSFVGNYVGGGLVIGLFYAYLNDHRKDELRPREDLRTRA